MANVKLLAVVWVHADFVSVGLFDPLSAVEAADERHLEVWV
jgi:hypothetical protein